MPALPGDSPTRSYLESFLRRIEMMPTSSGVSGAEALKRFEQVIPRLSDDEMDHQFVAAAEKVLSEMSDGDRMDIARRVSRIARELGIHDIDHVLETRTPQDIAEVMRKIAQEDRRALVRIFESPGGQPGSISEWVETPLAKRLFAGIAADVARTVLLADA